MTDEQIMKCWQESNQYIADFARAIESLVRSELSTEQERAVRDATLYHTMKNQIIHNDERTAEVVKEAVEKERERCVDIAEKDLISLRVYKNCTRDEGELAEIEYANLILTHVMAGIQHTNPEPETGMENL